MNNSEDVSLICLNPKCLTRNKLYKGRRYTTNRRQQSVVSSGLSLHLGRQNRDNSCHQYYNAKGMFIQSIIGSPSYTLEASIISQEHENQHSDDDDFDVPYDDDDDDNNNNNNNNFPVQELNLTALNNVEAGHTQLNACLPRPMQIQPSSYVLPSTYTAATSRNMRRIQPYNEEEIVEYTAVSYLVNSVPEGAFDQYMDKRQPKISGRRGGHKKKFSSNPSALGVLREDSLEEADDTTNEEEDPSKEDTNHHAYDNDDTSTSSSSNDSDGHYQGGKNHALFSNSLEDTTSNSDHRHTIQDGESAGIPQMGESQDDDDNDDGGGAGSSSSVAMMPNQGEVSEGGEEENTTPAGDVNTELYDRLLQEREQIARGLDKNALDGNYLNTMKNNKQLRMELELFKLMDQMGLPNAAFKTFINWAHLSEIDGHSFKEHVPRERDTVIEELSSKLNFKKDEVKTALIPWLPDKVKIPIHYRSIIDVFYSLMNRQDVVGPGGCNLSFPHPTDIYAGKPDTKPKYVTELHHGNWWLRTFVERCKAPNEILVPIILYMDGIAIDLMSKLKATPLNITFGIFNTLTRTRPEAWETVLLHPNDDVVSKAHKEMTTSLDKVKNLHAVLRVAFKDFLDVVEKGPLKFEIPYGGKNNIVHIKFCISFVIGDTEQHDALCGKFQLRTSLAKCICRHCNCPTDQLAIPESVHTAQKFTPKIVDPSPKASPDYYKSISHHANIDNAFYALDFGAREENIHAVSASPGENLHMNQKGVMVRAVESFKYLILNGAFVDSQGKAQSAADFSKLKAKRTLLKFNALGHQIGLMLTRQSDRNFPRTKFANSLFSATKKTGSEQAGVILCLLIAICTDRGRQLLLVDRTLDDRYIENTVTVLEKVLALDEWLKRGVYLYEEIHGKQDDATEGSSESGMEVDDSDGEDDGDLNDDKNDDDDSDDADDVERGRGEEEAVPSQRWEDPNSGQGLRFYMNQLMTYVRNCMTRGPTGMGNNTIKNHLLVHLPESCAELGNPLGVDSAPSERHHKTEVKAPAKRTQKRAGKFRSQIMKRKEEKRIVEGAQSFFGLGSRSSDNQSNPDASRSLTRRGRDNIPNLRHFDSKSSNEEPAESDTAPVFKCGGASFTIGYTSRSSDGHTLVATMSWDKSRNKEKLVHPESVITAICALLIQHTVFDNSCPKCVQGFTELSIDRHLPSGERELYRAHSSFRSNSKSLGDTWYDWAEFQWPTETETTYLPGQIFCFVKTGVMQLGTQYRGVPIKSHTFYALVTLFNNTPQPLRKSRYTDSDYTSFIKWGTLRNGYYLLPIRDIVGTVCVVMNIPELPDYDDHQSAAVDEDDGDEDDDDVDDDGTENDTSRSNGSSLRRRTSFNTYVALGTSVNGDGSSIGTRRSEFSAAHSLRRQRDRSLVGKKGGYLVIPNKSDWAQSMTDEILWWNEQKTWFEDGDDANEVQKFRHDINYSDDELMDEVDGLDE
jgi:hypothetical protein